MVVGIKRVGHTGRHTENLEPHIVSMPVRKRKRWWWLEVRRAVHTAHNTKNLEPHINLEIPVLVLRVDRLDVWSSFRELCRWLAPTASLTTAAHA